MIKKFKCWVFGHKPRGPVPIAQFGTPDIYYCCDRCYNILIFDPASGWVKVKASIENGDSWNTGRT